MTILFDHERSDDQEGQSPSPIVLPFSSPIVTRTMKRRDYS
jgi:hypothetical protein